MPNDRESTDIELKPKIDFYRDMLKSHVLGSNPLPQTLETEMERYISVFSLYLKGSNEAYKYNLPYLSDQHKGYIAFLISAPKKGQQLINIIKSVNESEAIKKIMDNNGIAKDEIRISLNDFLSADLSEKIDFHRSFSLLGAVCKKKDDLITVEYGQQVRVVRSQCLAKITTVVEKILNNSLNREVIKIVETKRKTTK